MTNILVYHIASGHAFFSGITLILLSLLFACRANGRWAGLIGRVTACVGLLLIAISSTPTPWWIDLVAGFLTIAWIGIEGSPRPSFRKPIVTLRWMVLILWLGLACLELPYHFVPVLPRLQQPTVTVVGDSISAGISDEGETWPSLLAKRSGLVVHNLSVASANVTTAKKQADRVTESNTLILVEIGGNDVLGGIAPEAFEEGLNVLLSQLRSKNQTVVLLELPLPPFHGRYGAIQRKLAKRHGVILVPKRVLLGVLTSVGATVDSLHLSKAGSEKMAEAIGTILNSGGTSD
jgi:acyl-CoA thioesterase-1